MKLLVLAALVAVAAAGECPAFGDWRDWTDKCLWFPLSEIRKDVIGACDVKVDMDALPTMPAITGLPEKCGHCSFKARCRKRARQDGCTPMDTEVQRCDEHGDVCDMPKFPLHNLGCRYEFAPKYLQQCGNRADMPDWKRDAFRKMVGMLPDFHCTKNGDRCNCCCHPYEPNADGSECVEIDEPTCEPWSEWTDWSEKCLWFPPKELHDDIISHCDIDVPADKSKKMLDKLKKAIPEGFEFPDRCGYCSFKIKCRKRDAKDTESGKKECFPFDAQKKACGTSDDCETCGEVCTLNKLAGSCNYTDTMRKMIGPGIKSRLKKMPHGMRDGLINMIAHLPHGKCKEIDGKCNCCCHPYEPSDDGSTCVLKSVCKSPEDMNVEVDMNLAADDAWFWF